MDGGTGAARKRKIAFEDDRREANEDAHYGRRYGWGWAAYGRSRKGGEGVHEREQPRDE